jgi:hypothetical protein
MTVEQQIENIRQARALIAEAGAGCGLPQIESVLADADMCLHWALWNLGEEVSLRPEIDPA